ncbi:MAG: hypothetical protein U9R23_02330 [Candidatus Cloacimonadota bacterium]|nr:hypothetical protein [Candidatus Cloacimonadota bacterium]
MKVSRITVIAIILLLITGVAFAKTQAPIQGKKREIVRQYRTLELLKILDLSEEESEVVLPILKEIDKNRETFYFQQQQLLNEIEFAIKQNEGEAKIAELNNKLMKLPKEFENKRAKFYSKLRSHLSEEQFAKFLVFNRRFKKLLQERIKAIHNPPLKQPPPRR